MLARDVPDIVPLLLAFGVPRKGRLVVKDLAALVEGWLDKGQYQELFTRACCLHFAVTAYRRGLGRLWFTESKVDKRFKAHVFTIGGDGKGLDVNGYNEISELLRPVAAWSENVPRLTTLAEIEKDVASLDFSEALNERVFRAAEEAISRIAEQGT